MTEQLTRKKILAMKPGIELDALVAEKVMGWRYKETVYSGGAVLSPAQWIKPNGWPVDIVPHYSTDISAAWEVVEKMSKTHFSEMAMTELEDGTWGWMARFIRVLNEPYTVKGYRATAKTAPEAICKAALLAVIDHD